MSKKRLLYSITRQKGPIFKKDTELSPVSIWKLASAQSLASTNPNSPSGIKSYKDNTHQFYASHYSDEENPSQVFTWSTESGGNSVMTVSADGLVTLVGTGIDMVTLSHSCLSASYKFKIDSAILPDGTYFLKNKRTEKYVDIYAQNMANGTDIHQWDFHGGNTQRWIFSYLGEGYYTFKSANSSDDYYLGVKNDGTATDTQIVLRTGTITDGMKWKISETASGAYKITPKTGEPNDRVLAVGWYALNVNGIDIKQQDYVDDNNYKDEWIICCFDHSILLAIDDTDGNSRHTYFSSTKSNLEQEKRGMVSVVSTNRYSACSVSSMISYLQSNDIFFIHTHGEKTGFKIATSGTTYIHMNDFTGVSLSNVKLAVLMTCNTGLDFNPSHITSNSPVNIVEKMVICGAETVVGFKDITKVSDCNKFAPDLTIKLVQNSLTIEDAIDSINYGSYIKNMANIAVIGGNTSNTIR